MQTFHYVVQNASFLIFQLIPMLWQFFGIFGLKANFLISQPISMLWPFFGIAF